MTSNTVQIISIIAPVGAVILGFALGVWWNSYQQKKRDQREIKAFLIRLEADLYHKLILLTDIEKMLYESKGFMSNNSPIIRWFSVPDLRKSFDIPLSFSIKYRKFSKQLYGFEGQMIHFNDEIQREKEVFDDIKQQYLNDKIAGRSHKDTSYDIKQEEGQIDIDILYIKDAIKEVSGYYYVVSVQFNKKSEQECKEELQKALDRRKHREPVAHKVS